jgi:hypothetical protein
MQERCDVDRTRVESIVKFISYVRLKYAKTVYSVVVACTLEAVVGTRGNLILVC